MPQIIVKSRWLCKSGQLPIILARTSQYNPELLKIGVSTHPKLQKNRSTGVNQMSRAASSPEEAFMQAVGESTMTVVQYTQKLQNCNAFNENLHALLTPARVASTLNPCSAKNKALRSRNLKKTLMRRIGRTLRKTWKTFGCGSQRLTLLLIAAQKARYWIDRQLKSTVRHGTKLIFCQPQTVTRPFLMCPYTFLPHLKTQGAHRMP